MLGFKRFGNAVVTISGIELANKIRKVQFNTSTGFAGIIPVAGIFHSLHEKSKVDYSRAASGFIPARDILKNTDCFYWID